MKKKPIKTYHWRRSPRAKNAYAILRFLFENKETLSPLLVLTHDYPDPDALASAFALHYIADQKYGILSRIAYGGIVGRMENRAMVSILKMPVHKLRPSDFIKYPQVALMDTQPVFQNNSFPKDRRATMIIDQHPFVKKPAADFVVVDTECGATSVILAQALLLARIEIPERLATALAYGILSDTLNLYRADRADVIQTYLDILPHCDLRALARIQNPTRSKRFFSTLGRAIQRAVKRRGILISHLGPVESPDLVSQTTDFLLTYRGVQWAVCTGRYKGKLHVSLRTSNPNAEAGEVLRDVFINRGEAGGHGAIGGGSFRIGDAAGDDAWQETEQALIERLLKRLRIPVKSEAYHVFREKEKER